MSTGRGSGAAGNVGSLQSIPPSARKMIQNLKEIVNCTEAEIYAALKECNMDLNDAVNRLLTQDPFREVKSKREKKKEGKDTTEPRSRGANNNPGRTGKTGADRFRGGPTHNSSESVASPGKTAYKKENERTAYSMSAISGNNKRVSAGPSDGTTAENKGFSFGAAETTPSGVQPASGHQSAWVGATGHVSMADIVKMGRPLNKTSNAPNASHHSDLRSPADHLSKDYESGMSSAQHIPINEEWPTMEKPPATQVSSAPYYAVDSEQHLEPPSDSFNRQSEAEEVQDEEEEDDNTENSGANAVESDFISSRKFLEDDSRGASLYENDLYKEMGPFHHQAPHDFDEVEDIGASVSAVTRNLQQLTVEKDDRRLPSEESNTPSVVIPDHLQVQNVDCSHLSFGSFGAGMGAVFSSGIVKSVPVETNMEEEHNEADIPSVRHMDSRSTDYYVDDSLRNASDGGLFHRSSASSRDYDPSSASQQEELKPENAEGAHGSQYAFPPSNSGYNFDGSQHINATFDETSSHMQKLAPFSDVMQSYSNALPSTLTPANVQPTRESDLRYSPFPVNQSMSDKFGNSVASIGGSAISMSEALKISLSQPAQQTHSGTGIATGPPPPPQHLLQPQYPQPSVPLGPYANMIGYPFLPQSYTYLPSAYQQAFAGNSSYHQSLAAAVIPQYKNNISASSLPQSGAGYGSFGNNTNIPVNPPTAPSGTNLNYDNALREQYRDNLVSLQQSDNSAMWLHGHNSRTMSAVPPSSYYNYQGQNQQSGGFRQAQQQPSQSYGTLGYPNFYHPQSGVSHDQQQQQQQQNPREAQQQQQPSKQSQIWPNNY